MARRVLLADDSIAIHKVVKLTFLGEDMEVIAVDNGAQAVQSALELKPDVVIADIIMPGLTGYEVCAELRRQTVTANTPVVLLVGAFESFDSAKAQEVGATAHLMKPIEPQSLLRLVRNLVGDKGSALGVEDNNDLNLPKGARSFEAMRPGLKLPPLELIDSTANEATGRTTAVKEPRFTENAKQPAPEMLDDMLDSPGGETRAPGWRSFELPDEGGSTAEPLGSFFSPARLGRKDRAPGDESKSGDEHFFTEPAPPVRVFNAPEPPAVPFFAEKQPSPAVFIDDETEQAQGQETDAGSASGRDRGERNQPASKAVNQPGQAALAVSPELVDEISRRVVERLRATLKEEVRAAIEEAFNEYLKEL